MTGRHPPSEQSFVETVEALSDIACLVGPDGVVVATNDAWRAFGEDNCNPYPASEGENYLEVCRQAGDDPYATEVAEALEQMLAGEKDEYRTTYPCPSPEAQRWFDLLAYRLDLDGGPYVLTLHVDATSQTEAEIAASAEVERLESLARVLSHDLRTPLSVASGYTQLLEEEVESSEHLERVQEALKRIGTIAENAVLIARGTDVDSTETIDLEDLAQRVWATLDTDDAVLSIDDDPTVEGDPGLVSELVENLLRNALDHAGDEPTVVLGPLSDGGFYVADDGPGIPEGVRDNVFDIGYTTGTGTGFGLDIVRRIASAHGWEVRATASEDGGARFELVTDGGD